MKPMHIILVLSLMAINVSCSSIYGVSHDYDEKADFSQLKTYDWLAVPEKADINQLDVERLKTAVNNQLEIKGFTMNSDTPDFSIAVHFGKKDKIKVSDWGYDYGPVMGPRRGMARGRGPVDVYQYQEGTLVLDFVDAKTKKLLWRGSGKARVGDAKTPEKRQKLINEAVEKILKKFPPAS
jgi:hypothetical protein